MKKVSFKESFEGGQCCSASDIGRKTIPHFGCGHRESTIANRGQTGAWHHKLRSGRRPQAAARRDVSDVMEIGGEVVSAVPCKHLKVSTAILKVMRSGARSQ
jgi:hypothetical protein